MTLDINAIRAELAKPADPLRDQVKRWADFGREVPALIAEIQRLAVYHDRYWAVEHVLNEALGPNEEDGTGEGIAADVALVVQQREEARAALAAAEQNRDRLTYERDQYRAESQRLGDQAQHLVNRVTAERERANEAARLSAAARDANDDLLAQVEKAREQVGIVEESRLDLIVENHKLEQDRDRLRDLITRLVDELEDLAIASCWQGNFRGCDNGGCVARRALLAEARAALDAISDIEPAAEDTAAIPPCQPIGCDNGFHLAGCRFADIDAAGESGLS